MHEEQVLYFFYKIETQKRMPLKLLAKTQTVKHNAQQVTASVTWEQETRF